MRPSEMIVEGMIIDVNDPQQMGRARVWVPAVDGEQYRLDFIPWATISMQSGGSTTDYRGGTGAEPSGGIAAYGLWTPPAVGMVAIVAFLYGNPNNRVVLATVYPDHRNRSLPIGKGRNGGTTDDGALIQPQQRNQQEQFAGNLTASEAQTRGVYERQVAQAQTDKDGQEGYQRNQDPAYTGAITDQNVLAPHTHCWTTPGRHAIIMHDHATNGRIRVKTAEGHQVILDDANERIYISTAKGRSWIEMDQDGHIHVYGSESISVHSEKDVNVTADRDINMQAGRDVNVLAGRNLNGSACDGLNLTGERSVRITSQDQFDIFARGGLIQEGYVIHLNGPRAREAVCPSKPPIVPQHEVWTRPATTGTRNRNWRP